MNFAVKIRDIGKITKHYSIGINVFGFENKEKHPIYVLKQICEEKHVDLLLKEELEKYCYFFKNFNALIYDRSFTTSWNKNGVWSDI